jgi:CRP/FNR family transcriptional regulator, cyclic AMP receptor protein
MTMHETLETLAAVPLFEGLSERELSALLASGEEVEFTAGREIVHEAETAEHFYVLLNGRATVWVQGRRRQELGPGDHFGEMAVLDGGPRSATVRAESAVRALRLDRSSFSSVLDLHGSIARRLLVELSTRLRAAEEALVHW